MTTPAFEWQVYEIPVEVTGGPHERAVAARDAGTMTVELPDLTGFATPLDKARILLESAAEVEHALLVQYLYAAFSLKGTAEFTDPAQGSAVQSWSSTLHHIARQEMGHLMTAQNLLLALGLPPNLEREDFPPQKDLYPFAMHLEPLSQRSLAKYVVAESPEDVAGIDDILAQATQSAGASINHVGVLYGLLGLVFSTRDQIAAGGSGSEPWDQMLRRLAAAADQQSAPASWHLPDDAIDPQTVDRQADPGRWQRGNTVHLITDRATALEAIRNVAEEGEGSVDGEESHFADFLAMYRGNGNVPFPAADGWVAVYPMPTDPRPADISEARTQRWAQLADIHYGFLLGAIEHHLRTTDEEDRSTLAGWAFQEMFALPTLAVKLATLTAGAGVGALPFTLPSPLPLPDTEAARWDVHLARTTAAIDKIEQMQALDSADAADDDLTNQLEASRQRRDLITGQAATPVATTSFARDILPLFRPVDIEHMNDQVGLDLSDFDVVRTSADAISRRMKGLGGRVMPPPPDPPLSAAQIALFDTWVAEGFPR